MQYLCGEQLDDSISQHCTEILDKWLQMSNRENRTSSTEASFSGFDSTIHNLIAKQTAQAVVRKPVDTDNIERKKAILAQYADVYDGEEYPL